MGERLRSNIPTAETTTKTPETNLPTFKVITDIPDITVNWITELHCLDLGNQARRGLLRAGITKVEELLTKSDQEILLIRGLGLIALKKIHTSLDKFRQRIITEEKRNPGQVVTIDIPSDIMIAIRAGKTPRQIYKEYGLLPSAIKQIVQMATPVPPIAEAMASLTPWQVRKYRDLFPALRRVIKKAAGATRWLGEIPRIYNDLTRAGFHLRVLTIGARSCFFVHHQEAKVIVEWLQESYKVEPKEGIIAFIKDLLKERPQRLGILSRTARQFGISRERVRQIVDGYEKRTGESLKQEKAISLYQLARILKTTPKTILNLLKAGHLSLGDPVDAFFTALDYKPTRGNQRRVIPKSLVTPENISALRLKLATRLLSEKEIRKTMEDLTLGVAKRNRDTYLSLLSLAKQAGIKSIREIGPIFEELVAAGFHLRKFPVRGITASYYVAHKLEVGEIVTYLKREIEAKRVDS